MKYKYLCVLIWNILILLSSCVIFVMILSLKVSYSQYFHILEICLSIVNISKTIITFFERFHFGIILPVML